MTHPSEISSDLSSFDPTLELPEDAPAKNLKDFFMNLTEKWYFAFYLGKFFWGNAFLWHPKVIRNRIRYYARRYDSGHYWYHNFPGVHFLERHSECAVYAIDKYIENLPALSVLELCGGCGNVGLILKRRGIKDYFLNEKSRLVIRWAKKLFRDYSFDLKAADGDFRELSLNQKFDIVLALGFENGSYSYEDIIKKACEHQSSDGWVIVTYVDQDEYFAGEWNRYYKKWHGSEFEFKKGNYIIEKSEIIKIFEHLGYEVKFIHHPSRKLDGRVYPRYLLGAKKASHPSSFMNVTATFLFTTAAEFSKILLEFIPFYP